MTNKIIITDSGQFEEIIQSLEESYNKIKDIFINQRSNAEKINGTETWTGAAAEAMYGKYQQLAENFEPIEFSLELYIKFLKKTLEDYTRLEEEMNKNLDALQEQLDVVS